MTSYEAVIFDMDGVLIDSEPFWREAEMEVFARVGLQLTEADCALTMGRRIDEVVDFWYERRPWASPPKEEVEQEIVVGVARRIDERGAPLPGIYDLLDRLKRRGLRLALASSSSRRLIEAALEVLGLHGRFEVVTSGVDVGAGKPDPAIYLETAMALEVSPVGCLAIEDSPNGVRAAKAAGMDCIALAREHVSREDLSEADAVIASLDEIAERLFESLEEKLG